MIRHENREGMQWLGGEAHVRPPDGRRRFSSLRRWVASGNIRMLAGTAVAAATFGSLGTFSVMKTEHQKPPKEGGVRKVKISSERSEPMKLVREDERRRRSDEAGAMGAATVLAAFGLGLLAGAVVTLLTTPESGLSVRTRLKRGAEAAKRELCEMAGETKVSWDRVRKETGVAVTHMGIRIKEAGKVTKEALTEEGTSVPKTL